MKQIRRICAVCVPVLLVFALGFSFLGCNEEPPAEKEKTVRWELSHDGEMGADSIPSKTTENIIITFSGNVTVTEAEITIGGVAERNSEEIVKEGKKYKIPVTVSGSGTATVTVTKEGIASGSKNITVYKEGEAVPISYTVVADGNAGATSTKITFTFEKDVTIAEGDIIVTPGTGSVTTGSPTKGANDKIWVLAITEVVTSGSITVKITKAGIDPGTKPVTVYKQGEAATVSYKVLADGDSNNTSTKLTFTFDTDVTISDTDITINNLTGSITKVTLSMGENNKIWNLVISNVTAGVISVKITKDGIDTGTKPVIINKKIDNLGTNPVSGKTTYLIDDGKITFNADGTYTISRPIYVKGVWIDDPHDGGGYWGSYYDTDGDGKYKWDIDGEGIYNWNTTNQTVTLTLNRERCDIYNEETNEYVPSDYPMNVAEFQFHINKLIKNDWEKDLIQGYMDKYDLERNEAIDMLINIYKKEDDRYSWVTTFQELVDMYIILYIDYLFSPISYNYSDIKGNLFLQKSLPASKGENELAGKTFRINFHDDDDENNEYYIFASDETYSRKRDDAIFETGKYSFDSTKKIVYWQPITRSGMTITELFDYIEIEGINRYPTEDDYKIAEIVDSFNYKQVLYDPLLLTIGERY